MTTEIVSVKSTMLGVADLIAASKSLLNATEQQFETMRKEKWFHRAFDMLTFSQKKNIRLGEQIQTLAQAQNIILEMLPRLAAEHADIAAYICEERTRIEELSQNDLSLLRLYKDLLLKLDAERLGIKKAQDVADLSEIDRLALSACLRELSQYFETPSELQQQYFNEIHSYMGCECESDINWDQFCGRPEEIRKQTLQCCLEYIFLYHNSLELSEDLSAFIANFDLGSKTIRDRSAFVAEMFHARGVDGIIGKYSGCTFEDISMMFSLDLEDFAESDSEIVSSQNTLVADKLEHSFNDYYSLAESGDADAQCKVGRCYYDGIGIKKDIKQAVEWYSKAAEQGHADAQNRLGVRYLNGDGVEEDESLAAKLFEQAALQGHAKAQCNLGICYFYGYGLAEDNEEAFRWFSLSAEQNHADAQCFVGKCYFSGCGVKEDYTRAAYWFEKAAYQGDADAQYYLGLLQGADGQEATKWFFEAAKQGHAGAQYELGVCYYEGTGVEEDDTQAVYWFKKATEQNEPDAQFYLGLCFYSGRGVSEDKKQAAIWFQKAADQDQTRAQFYLGLCYLRGWGVTQSNSQAELWFKKAAEKDDAEAQFFFGGLLLEKNAEKGAKWIKKSAEQNFAGAQYLLGQCCAAGQGVEKNPVEAVHWYKKAAEQEEPNALLRLGICYMYGTGDGLLETNHGVIKDLRLAYECLSKALEKSETVESLLDDEDIALIHKCLAEVLYAQNVRDNLTFGTLDYVNCIPGPNLVSIILTGVRSSSEKTKLRNFLTTEDGRAMMQHCKAAAELGNDQAAKMLKKIKSAL